MAVVSKVRRIVTLQVLSLIAVTVLWSAPAPPTAAEDNACAQLRQVIQQSQSNANDMASAGAAAQQSGSSSQAGSQIAVRDRARQAYSQLGCGSSGGGGIASGGNPAVNRAVAGA